MIKLYDVLIIDNKSYLVIEILTVEKIKTFFVYDQLVNKIKCLNLDFDKLTNIIKPNIFILEKFLNKINNQLDIDEKNYFSYRIEKVKKDINKIHRNARLIKKIHDLYKNK